MPTCGERRAACPARDRPSPARAGSSGAGGGNRRDGGPLRLSFLEGLGGSVDDVGDLGLAEAGHVPELASQVDRVLLAVAPQAAKAEQLVDRALEGQRLLEALLVVQREAPEPVRT